MWDLIVSVPDHCLSFYFALLEGCLSQLNSGWKTSLLVICLVPEFHCITARDIPIQFCNVGSH